VIIRVIDLEEEAGRRDASATFAAFLLRMQFVIVSEVDLVDKLREL
jgi:hypothetical protein